MRGRFRAFHPVLLITLILGAVLVPWEIDVINEDGDRPVWRFARSSPSGHARILDSYAKLPRSFEMNAGQTDSQVKFLSRAGGYSVFLTSTGAVVQLPRRRTQPAREPGSVIGKRAQEPSSVVRMELAGATSESEIQGVDELPGKTNYFIGDDPKEWRTNVSTFARIRYKGVYPGVDLVYYGNQSNLEFDFIVAPGANPQAIRLAFPGIEGEGRPRIDQHGDLVMAVGGSEFRLHKPILYQEIDGDRRSVDGKFAIRGAGYEGAEIGFDVAPYDGSQPLVIDPVLSYSTNIGADGGDFSYGIAVDSSGSAYVTGYTGSVNFPTTNGALKRTAPLLGTNNNLYDAFVTKFSADGSSLVYSTYLGGTTGAIGPGFPHSDDTAFRIAIDSSGNAYVTGYTVSTDFPITDGAFQTSNAGNYDGFVTKLNADGSALVYSTYLGGNDYEQPGGIAVDSSGNAYVTGLTYGNSSTTGNFPTTVGAFQPDAPAPGSRNAFVAKFSATGSIVYSTYLGGPSGEAEAGGIAADSSGNAYVTGYTNAPDFPTKNPFDGTVGIADAFITKLNASGSALVFSTFFGGEGSSEQGKRIVLDSSGNIYILGVTGGSSDFPLLNSFSQTGTIFVAKFDNAGSSLLYSTRFGGTGSDTPYDLAADAAGSAYITGTTGSIDFPTASAYKPNPPGSINNTAYDAFVTKLSPSGSALVYSTYLGGNNNDTAFGIAVDASGAAYVAGHTHSDDFPRVNPFQSSPNGSFVTKFGAGQLPDQFSEAIVVQTVPFSDTIITTPATVDAADPVPECGGGSRQRSVWYRYTAPSFGMIVADTFGSDYDTILSVYTGSPGSFVQAACNDDAPGVPHSRVSFLVNGGTTYYFMISAKSAGGPDEMLRFHLDFFFPGDDHSRAYVIESTPFSTAFPLVGSTTAATDPFPSCNTTRANSIWFQFTPSADGTFVADTLGSDFDSVLSVYTGSPGSFVEAGCNDDTAGGLQSQLTFAASAGVTYSLMVSKFGPGGSALSFHFDQQAAVRRRGQLTSQ